MQVSGSRREEGVRFLNRGLLRVGFLEYLCVDAGAGDGIEPATNSLEERGFVVNKEHGVYEVDSRPRKTPTNRMHPFSCPLTEY